MKKLSLDSEVFTRAVEDIVTRGELKKLLSRNRVLRIKHGIDASGPELHIGHAVSLWKLRALQEAGHKAVILLGDVTTQIGDPTGKLKTRPMLPKITIKKNIAAVKNQLEKILHTNPRVYELHYSSEWYNKMRAPEFLKLLSHITHARLIERDMFQGRLRKKTEIYMSELIYPVLQGYDSVILRSDLTIVGSDQLFNEHLGRMFQEKFGQPPQVIVALKILPGVGGGEKMSKSLGNYIGLSDSPQDKFGKAMRLLDSLIVPYLEVYTDVPPNKIRGIEHALRGGQNPMAAKLFFAEALVRRYHGNKVAQKERDRFLKIFSKKEFQKAAPLVTIKIGRWELTELLLRLGFAASKSDARRLIAQGAVEIDGKRITVPSEINIKHGSTIRAGKRRLARVE